MKPIIKWPGGKAEEIKEIIDIIPSYNRYVEPFVGGGAVYFFLPDGKALINDISVNLTNLYKCIKENNQSFKNYLIEMNVVWEQIKEKVNENIVELLSLYKDLSTNVISFDDLNNKIEILEDKIIKDILKNDIIKDKSSFIKEIRRNVKSKYKRTVDNERKIGVELSRDDLIDNILTGFTGSFYMYIRNEHNKVEKSKDYSVEYRTALFYFVREFCYGSMFRYNTKGDFNIPYGGIAYNNKDFSKKISNLFSNEILNKFSETEIMCGDFSKVMERLDENDFMFVDPPYDTEFSDYEGRAFEKNDQERLRDALASTRAKFILIIKNTEFIYNLYNRAPFTIKSFDKNYAYCVKNRNDRAVDHLIITNY